MKTGSVLLWLRDSKGHSRSLNQQHGGDQEHGEGFGATEAFNDHINEAIKGDFSD